MTAQNALHLMLSQQSLELRGWRFTPIPPREGQRHEWRVGARSVLVDVMAEFSRPQRHDALAQALQWAEMTDAALNAARNDEPADTVRAPAMLEGSAAE